MLLIFEYPQKLHFPIGQVMRTEFTNLTAISTSLEATGHLILCTLLIYAILYFKWFKHHSRRDLYKTFAYSYSRIVSIKRIVSHFAVSVLKDNMHLVLGLPFTVWHYWFTQLGDQKFLLVSPHQWFKRVNMILPPGIIKPQSKLTLEFSAKKSWM